MTSLKELKTLIKETLTEEGLGPALKQLKATWPENSKAYDEAVLLEAALKEANLKMARGSIGQTELDVLYNSLRARLMTLLDSLDADDARSAAGVGASAVIVSNHGGRQLEGAPSSISVLPRIRDAVGDRLEILMDGGIRSGQDLSLIHISEPTRTY